MEPEPPAAAPPIPAVVNDPAPLHEPPSALGAQSGITHASDIASDAANSSPMQVQQHAGAGPWPTVACIVKLTAASGLAAAVRVLHATREGPKGDVSEAPQLRHSRGLQE